MSRHNRVADALVDWIPLVDPSGPFLTLPVLKRAFPHGMDRVASEVRAETRQWLEALSSEPAERAAWLRWVLVDLLEYGSLLRERSSIPDSLQHTVPEHGITLRPDFALVGPPEAGAPAGRPRLLIEAYPVDTDLAKRLPDQRWTATPVERMALLCRATGVELGVVTDTNAFTLVWAPRGGSTATATWLADLWSEERGLFDAFTSLLGARRFFSVAPSDTLEALLAESATAQIEVTNKLGTQVRLAVELLIDAFSLANRESGGQLLDDLGAGDLETAAEEVYAAAVTVMMRLVFLLCAEERALFPVGDALYDASYAVSTLLDTLREEANLSGEETLERRTAAWYRLLATFRLVHDGIQHETLRIPAYGGSLFDPDKFPFLEGRRPSQATSAGITVPPAVSDRSVMAILDALQYLSFKGETRRVSYRSLDVEQIGHVYEGLLDHGCQIVDEIVLGLSGKAEPELPLGALEAAAVRGRDALTDYIQEMTGRSGTSSITRDLDCPLDADTRRYLLEACENDHAVFERIAPFVGLLRRDLRGLPVVFLPDSLCVMQTSSRRDSGTEYTTKELADEVVRYALEPLVYSPGPQDGVPQSEWKLRTSAEILALRVCDPAVGSGAILVAACRYLAERLAEAWAAEETLPPDACGDLDSLTVAARRAVVDHCLYGVDRNPMATEMAKLSLWLVTMAKERPFSFLDHAIQSGDSLLGLASMDQLTTFHIDPVRGRALNPDLFGHAAAVEAVVRQAVEKFRAMTNIKVLTVRDAEDKARLHAEATATLAGLLTLADAVVGAALATAPDGAAATDDRLLALAGFAAAVAEGRPSTAASDANRSLRVTAAADLATGLGPEGHSRMPLHWPLAFPEVFLGKGKRTGFDAIVGNPPFLGGLRIGKAVGSHARDFMVEYIAGGRRGSADLSAYFFLRSSALVTSDGVCGLLATNSIAQGDTREVGLDWLCANGWRIYRAVRSTPWPGSASLEIAKVWMTRRVFACDAVLDGVSVPGITPLLRPLSRASGTPHRIAANQGLSFQGSNVLGAGFIMTPEEAKSIIAHEPRSADVLFPYINGEDLVNSPDQSATRWVINFADWPIDRARQYATCFRIVDEKVRPERARNNDRNRRELWWRFTRPTVELYRAISGMERVLARAITGKHHAFAFVQTGVVFDQTCPVYVFDDDFHFGVVQSDVHRLWWLARGATYAAAPRYTPTDCFETFVFPKPDSRLREIASQFDSRRREYTISRQIGLTAFYNRFHDAACRESGVSKLRKLQRQMDEAAVRAYGWTDLRLDHDFHRTEYGTRFGLSPALGVEIVDRLVELNHARYTEEVRLGLHEHVGRRATAKRPARAANVEVTGQGDLLASLAPSRPTSSRKRS